MPPRRTGRLRLRRTSLLEVLTGKYQAGQEEDTPPVREKVAGRQEQDRERADLPVNDLVLPVEQFEVREGSIQRNGPPADRRPCGPPAEVHEVAGHVSDQEQAEGERGAQDGGGEGGEEGGRAYDQDQFHVDPGGGEEDPGLDPF